MTIRMGNALAGAIGGLCVLAAASGASAGAIRDSSFFTTNTLAANDDGSTDAVNLGFSVNVNGTSYSTIYVNNNGNVTFSQPLSTYTPNAILSNSFPIIAPFWADVDTRGSGSGLTTYSAATIDGQNVFGVNWIGVGYYGAHTDKLNSFQLILTDVGNGDFDIEFNYDTINWETGDASGGSDGLGGTSAAVGYVVGENQSYQLPGSFVNGALLNGGPDALISHSLNSDVLGRYDFYVRGGEVIGGVPEPSTWAMMIVGFVSLGFLGARRVKTAMALG